MGLYKTKKKTKKNYRKTKKNYYKLIGGKAALLKMAAKKIPKNIKKKIPASTSGPTSAPSAASAKASTSGPTSAPGTASAKAPTPGSAKPKPKNNNKSKGPLASTQGESKMATNFKKDVNKTKLNAIKKIKKIINSKMANLSGIFVMNVLKEICQESGNCSESLKKQFFKVCIPDKFKNYSKEIETISIDYKYSKDEPLKKPVNPQIKNAVKADTKSFKNKIVKKEKNFNQCKKVIDSNFDSCVNLLALLSLGIYKTLFIFSNFKDLSKEKKLKSNCNIEGLKKKSTNVIFSEVFDSKTFEQLGIKTKNAIHNLSKLKFKGLDEAILNNNPKKVASILSGASAISSSASSGAPTSKKNISKNTPQKKKNNEKKPKETTPNETSTTTNNTSKPI